MKPRKLANNKGFKSIWDGNPDMVYELWKDLRFHCMKSEIPLLFYEKWKIKGKEKHELI